MQTFTDLYRYRFILSRLIDKELKAQYRNMSLGFLWALINPLVLITVLTFVWTNFLPDDPTFPAKVVVALIPYNFFLYCLSGCAASVHGNATLVKRIRFPRQILPFSVILTHLIHFAVQSILIVAVLILLPTKGNPVSFHLLWLPLILIVHIGLVAGVGLLVAGLTVFYRDVQYIVESSLTVLFWISPILYSAGAEWHVKVVDKGYPWLYYVFHLNPLSGILEAYRSVLYFGRAPDAYSFAVAAAITVAIGYIGVKSFWKNEREFADRL